MLNHQHPHVFSGEIGNDYVSSLDFKTKKLNFILKRLYEFFTGYICVEYKTKDVVNIEGGYEYFWLKPKNGSITIKVWKEGSRYAPSNCSKIYHSGRVLIKGVGDFKWSDFEEVLF